MEERDIIKKRPKMVSIEGKIVVKKRLVTEKILGGHEGERKMEKKVRKGRNFEEEGGSGTIIYPGTWREQ
jgi:hypothetical protein